MISAPNTPVPNLRYIADFLSPTEAEAWLEELIVGTPWEHREVHIHGRRLKQPRLVAWYGDSDSGYRYSGISHEVMPWTWELRRLADRVGDVAGERFNGVLCNYYRDQNDSVAWHADDEAELGPEPLIASLSVGTPRRFLLKHRRTKTLHAVELGSGSLLIMERGTQAEWNHALPKTKRPKGPRVNLTFRRVHAQGS